MPRVPTETWPSGSTYNIGEHYSGLIRLPSLEVLALPAVAIAFMLAFATQLNFGLDEFGRVKLSDAQGPVCEIRTYVHGPQWSYASQEMARELKVGQARAVGALPMPQRARGQMKFNEAVAKEDGRVVVEYTVQFTADSEINGAYVAVSLPAARWKGRQVIIAPAMDKQKLPAAQGGPTWRAVATALGIQADGGRWLVIGSPSAPQVALEDMRRFGGDVFELRYYLASDRVVAGQEAHMRLVFAETGPEQAIEGALAAMAPQVTIDRRKPYAVVGEDGHVNIAVGDSELATVRIGIHGLKWAFADQGDVVWRSRYGDLQRRVFDGVVDVPGTQGKKIDVREQAEAADNELRLKYRFRFPEATPLNGYQVSVYLPLGQWNGAEILIEGGQPAVVRIPEKMEKPFLASTTVSAVRVKNAGKPELVIRPDAATALLVQDNRNWGGDNVELRFNFLRAETGSTVAAGTVTERTFTVTTREGLQPVLDAAAVTDAYDQSQWVPFTLPWDKAPVDLSWLNDKPAGKHGRLVVRDGHFYFEDGTPARFWGTCFSAGANFPTHEQAEKIARRLASFGVNIVRTHHADAYWAERNFFGKGAKDTRHFDPEALDRFDYLIYCLEREGIYIYLDQLVNRKFTAADGVDAADALPVCGKPYSNFDPKLIELQKEFSRMLWTHVNPYTGKAYKDDPAIVLMEFANENDLFTQAVTLEPYRTRLEQMYRQWAREHGVRVPPGKVDFRRRTDAIMAFFIDLQRKFYEEMRRYLREVVGVRVPMTGSNWSRNAALLAALEVCDYTDSHAYWNHPTRQGTVRNTPAMRTVAPLVNWLSFNRLAGKPFFVSEWNEPWHNEWRAEMPLFMAAVAALQAWDGLTIYTYAHTSERMPGIDYLSGAFETFNDPALFGLFPHAALIYRRGDVRPAREKWVIVVPEDRIAVENSLAPWHVKALRGLPEVHQTFMALRKAPAWAERVLGPDEQPLKNPDQQTVSDTGEIRHYPAKGYCLVDSPRTQAVMGFVGEAGEIEMSAVRIRSRTDFATIAVSSLTDEPLAQSRRILVTAVGRVENKGTRYDVTHQRLVSRGTGPIMCEPIKATVRIKTGRGPFDVYAIGPDGSRRKIGGAVYAGGTLRLKLGPQARTIYYELVAKG